MPRIWTELSRALRSLRQSPGPAAVAIVSLALGLGANVTVYSVVREMILDNVSARRPERLVRAGSDVSYAAYRDLRRDGVFRDLAFDAGLDNAGWNRAGRGEVVWELETSANFFEVLGIRAAAGRLYMQTDEGLVGVSWMDTQWGRAAAQARTLGGAP